MHTYTYIIPYIIHICIHLIKVKSSITNGGRSLSLSESKIARDAAKCELAGMLPINATFQKSTKDVYAVVHSHSPYHENLHIFLFFFCVPILLPLSIPSLAFYRLDDLDKPTKFDLVAWENETNRNLTKSMQRFNNYENISFFFLETFALIIFLFLFSFFFFNHE